MAEAPIPGRVKKDLTPPLDYQSASRLHECFIMDAAEKGARIPDVDLVVSCAPTGTIPFFRDVVPGAEKYIYQTGKNPSAKLVNLFKALSEPGRAVVAVGVDLPTLPARCLELAFDALDTGSVDVVLGPATGGGCYLVGMTSPVFELLHYVPWGTSESLDGCVDRAAELGLGWYLLPEWRMVKAPADLSILKRELLDGLRNIPLAHHTRAYLACLRDSGKL